MNRVWILAFTTLVLLSCKERQKTKVALFSNGKSKGIVDTRLEEASGLVESVSNPGFFWTVNDSGNPPEVFLIDSTARIKMVCTLPVKNRDWEDIALGPGPDPAKKYVYVADIGDNFDLYQYKYLYRFEEPVSLKEKDTIIADVERLVVKLPDGKRDSETLMIDPATQDLYLVSKREERVNIYFHTFPYPDTVKLKMILKIPFTKIVAGSISTKGDEVVLKDYDHIYYWRRKNESSLSELFSKKPIQLSYTPELQGEAICWAGNGNGFYTLGESPEHRMARLLFYQRLR